MRNITGRTVYIMRAMCCFCLAGCLLTGCAPKKADAPLPPPAASFVENELTRAANRIGERMDQLLAVSRSLQGPPPSARVVPPASGPLTREITTSWNDSLDSVLRKIVAELPGWKLRITGRAPVEPLVVNLQGRMTVFAALENVGWQAGNRADVRVGDGHVLLAWQGMVEPYEQLRNAAQDIPWNGKRDTLIGGVRRNLPKGWKYESDPAVRNIYVKTRTDRKNWREAITGFAREAGASVVFDEERKLIILGR